MTSRNTGEMHLKIFRWEQKKILKDTFMTSLYIMHPLLSGCRWVYCWSLQRNWTRKICFSDSLNKNCSQLEKEKSTVQWTSRDQEHRSNHNAAKRPAAQRSNVILILNKVIGKWDLWINKLNFIFNWWLVRGRSILTFQSKEKIYLISYLLNCFLLVLKQFKSQKG